MTTDATKQPPAITRRLILDVHHVLDRLAGAAFGSPDINLTDAIGALRSAHNALQRAFERLIHIPT